MANFGGRGVPMMLASIRRVDIKTITPKDPHGPSIHHAITIIMELILVHVILTSRI